MNIVNTFSIYITFLAEVNIIWPQPPFLKSIPLAFNTQHSFSVFLPASFYSNQIHSVEIAQDLILDILITVNFFCRLYSLPKHQIPSLYTQCFPVSHLPTRCFSESQISKLNFPPYLCIWLYTRVLKLSISKLTLSFHQKCAYSFYVPRFNKCYHHPSCEKN